MINDIVADALARIKNAVMRESKEVTLINSKLVKSILDVMKQEEFIDSYEVVDNGLKVVLSYENDMPVVSNFIKVSKPGQRIYVAAKELIPVMNGRGISVISTSQGVMTGALAKSKGLGGEYICKIW
ncbi:MAG: 30S ribosomal protein S8 [Candidatus Dojkabacteria bacterium]